MRDPFLFVDFQLGNPCGKPWDVSMKHPLMVDAFYLLKKSLHPRTTVQDPFVCTVDVNELWRNR